MFIEKGTALYFNTNKCLLGLRSTVTAHSRSVTIADPCFMVFSSRGYNVKVGSIYLSFYLNNQLIHLYLLIYMYISISIYTIQWTSTFDLFNYLLIYLSIYLSIYKSINLLSFWFIRLPKTIFIFRSIILSLTIIYLSSVQHERA